MSKKPREVTVKPQPQQIVISTESQEKPSWDSTAFDSIDPARINKAFKQNYDKHVEFLVNIVTARMSMDTAMVNTDNAIKEHMNEALSVYEDATNKAIDGIFDIALRTYAADVAFSFLDADLRKELLVLLMAAPKGSSGRLSAPKGSNEPAGFVSGHVLDDLTKGLRRVERFLGNKLGEQLPPYGHQEPDGQTSGKKKVTKKSAGAVVKNQPRKSR